MLPVFNVLEEHLVYTVINTCVLASCPTCSISKATNMMFIFPVVSSITTFLTVPIAPFVNPTVTSILVVLITLALIFTVRTFFRLPV